MTLPSLPVKGSVDWYSWVQGVDAALRGGPAAVALNVKDYGAKGDGVTDDSVAFGNVAIAARNAVRSLPLSLQADKVGSVIIDVPPGDYLITNPGALLGDEAPTQKGVGLRWRGSGRSISNLIFKPATASAMAFNDYWQELQFEDLGFIAATAGCTFLQSYTTHAAQRYLFKSCRFWYWKYGVALQGDNNNSEINFFDCHTAFTETAGAFFYVGATNTADQFLNYWFYGCTHWSTSAPFIDAARGGSFHIYGLDVSDWGAALTSTGYLFHLRGYVHAYGVCNFEATGLRVEAKNGFAGLLHSEWEKGNVALRSVDWSSQSTNYTYGDIVFIDSLNSDAAVYAFHDSILAGTVRVRFAVNDWQYQHLISFTNCTWLQKHSPSDVVNYDTSAAGANSITVPPVEFIRCRGTDNNIFATVGAAVWDATIGYRGQPLQSLRPRVVSLRAVYGTAAGTDVLRVSLPVGALITGLEALSPAGAVTEGDGGTWTLATTDATPVTVAAATVTGAMSAGFDVNTTLAVPFLCSTTAKATLTLTPTNVGQYNTAALVLIKGYW